MAGELPIAEARNVPTSATPDAPTTPPAPVSPDPTSPPCIPDHTLLRRIAGGGYGEVWLARSALGTWRAVKIVHRRNFDHDRPYEREFAGLQRYEPVSRSHDDLVDVLQVGRNDEAGYFYYVMELADPVGSPKSKSRIVPGGGARSSTGLRTSHFGVRSSFGIRGLALGLVPASHPQPWTCAPSVWTGQVGRNECRRWGVAGDN